MSDSELPGDERASYDRFPTESPIADALQAIRSLRKAPRMPDVPAGASRDEVLRAVTNVVVEINERERRLVGALELLAQGLQGVVEQNARIEEKIDTLMRSGAAQ